MIEGYLEQITGDPVVFGVIVGFVLLLGLLAWRGLMPKRRPVADSKTRPTGGLESLESKATEVEASVIDTLGKGDYKCLAFLNGNIARFTKMPKPIGEGYSFDPSMPVSGFTYIVKEAVEGVVDYDPRQVKVKIEEMPERAYFAISWGIVPVVFKISLAWWKTRSVWFAAGMMAILFIATLVFLE